MGDASEDRTEHRRRRPARGSLRALLLVLAGPFIASSRSLVRVGKDPETQNILVGAGLLLLSGMVLFRLIEDLSWLDALYFSFITLSTIGYGDITPTTELGKIVTILYSIAGLGVLAALIHAIVAHAPRRAKHDSG